MTEPMFDPKPGALWRGFVTKTVTPVPALRGTAVELVHTASGARILHLVNDDTENLFSVTFPTPPPDDTGVPHILEHSVLAGSQRFPVREPFFEMLKSSMATFINAMTGPDCTYYPVSSNVRKDLFNLAEVYFDAVFHPLLTPEIFMREGHHLAPADTQDPAGALTVSGIVYNEMKGVFSNPEQKLFYLWLNKLVPDTPYARNYAGHPDAIPGLSFETFKAFHATHYHPSNALFYFYGNIETAAYLEFLEPRLAGYSRQAPEPIPARQCHWTAPRRCADTYPVAPDETLAEKTYIALSWLAGNALDLEESILFHVLSNILFGNEAAPLKKALIDSQLGQDLLECGDMEMGMDSLFLVGLQGSEPERADAFETLVLSTLKELAEQGLKPEWVESAFRQTAYHYLEILPMFPLHTMNKVISAWSVGADPTLFLDMGRRLEAARARHQADPTLFSRLILDRLVNNPHRLMSVLSPDAGRQARDDAAFTKHMAAERASLTKAQTIAIAEKAAAIEAAVGEPNPPDKIALLPQLKVGDLPAKPRHIPTVTEFIPARAGSSVAVPVLRNDCFSNGVNYLQFSLDLAGLPDDLWPILPYYCDTITKLGAAGMNYEAMARRVAAATGGISCSPSFSYHATCPGQPVLTLRFACKALDNQVEEAMGVLRDLVFAADPRDRARMKDVLVQARAGCRSDILENGHSYAQCHAARQLTAVGLLDERCHGIPQAALIARLCDGFDKEAESLMDRIEQVRAFILSPDRLTVSVTGSDQAYTTIRSAFGEWTGSMKGIPVAAAGTPADAHPAPAAPPFAPEGLAVPIQVAHCAQGLPAPRLQDPRAAALSIGAHLLRFEYFLTELRLKGNAYGGGISYNPASGTLFMTSYRDPHVARTLDVFAKTPEFVKAATWSQADVDRAIIGTSKGDEKPLRPGEATGDALSRRLQGVTPELREAFYASRLAVTPEAARTVLLETLDTGLASSAICVLSSREKLEDANKTLGSRALAIEDVVM